MAPKIGEKHAMNVLTNAGRTAGAAFVKAHPDPSLDEIRAAVGTSFMAWTEKNPAELRKAAPHISCADFFRRAFWEAVEKGAKS